jgi:FtsP/CotA-like multicopper oxidase with cupredoxin domain
MNGHGVTTAAIVSSAAAVLGIGYGVAARQTAPFDPCAIVLREPDRQKFVAELVARFGGRDFENPPEVSPTRPERRYTLRVRYATNVVAGCRVQLRSYNGKLVGDTIRARAGESLYLRVMNDLPDVPSPHPQEPPPDDHAHVFSFNDTNLHTHGLHTAPQGTAAEESDNVLLDIQPGHSQNYRVDIDAKHPAGTFWYHPHSHGSTAIQVSSGMGGALIVDGASDAHGGLDTVPVIAAAKHQEKILVLQQLNYDATGRIETFTDPSNRNWLSRVVTVNGLLAPVIRMRPGEIQRWRFIHAGVQENISLSLAQHQLHEIAADGIALGRRVSWPATQPIDGDRNILLGPGYRVDVLVQANALPAGEKRHTYILRGSPLSGRNSITISTANRLRLLNRLPAPASAGGVPAETPESIIAQVVVEGPTQTNRLPDSGALRDRVPSELPPITDEELATHPDPSGVQNVTLTMDGRTCSPAGDCPPTPQCDATGDCPFRFMVNDRVYMPSRSPRVLKLGTASTWVLKGNMVRHPFHIHTNPFQVQRVEPGPNGRNVTAAVWKDTLLLPFDESAQIVARSRYTRFTGEFVLHCHILGHEDSGMMERVKITQ